MPSPFKTLLLIASSFLLFCSLPDSSVFATETDRLTTLDRYQKAIDVDPDNPTLHYILGLAQLKNGKPKAALSSFRTAYPAYTRSIEMQLNMGMAYLQIGDEESSMLYLEQAESLGALQTQSRTPLINAYYKAGLNYLEQENLNEASKLFKRVLSLDRARVEIYRLLGDLAAKKGLREEAIAHFKKYLELYPKDQAANEYLYSLYFNYANQLMEKGEFKAAQVSFKAAQAIVPKSPLILYSLGSLAYNDGDTKRAIQHLAVVYVTAPDELRESTRAMLYNSALSSLNAHHLDLAVAAISPLSKGSDAQIKDLSLAGAIYLERHEFKIAREIFLRILNRDPTHPQAIINISIAEENAVEELFQEGLVAYKKGKYKEAIAYFDEALSLQPDERRSNGYRKKSIKKITNEAKSIFKNARKAITDKDYLKAILLTNEGLTLTPNNTNGLRLKREALQALEADINQLIKSGFDLLQQSDFAAAEAKFNKVLQIDPENSQARHGLTKSKQQRQTAAQTEIVSGNAALEEGDLKGAEKHFKTAQKLVPHLPGTIRGMTHLDAIISTLVAQELQLGRGSRSAGNLKQAQIHFTKALNLKNSPEIKKELESILLARTNQAADLLQAARTARQKKEFKTALSIYNRIIKINPQHPAKDELSALRTVMDAALATKLEHASQKSEQGDFKSALSLYRQALDLEPTNKEALHGLQTGRKKIEAEVVNNLQAGRSAFDSGDLIDSTAAYKRVLQLDPYQAEAKSSLKKIARLEQTGIRPGDEDRLYLQGIEFYTSGKYSEAIKAWQKVLQLAPKHDKARLNIKKAKHKLKSIREFKGG